MQPDLVQLALPEWGKNGKNIQQEVDTLWRIFEAAFLDDAFRSTICVIDGLDECRRSDQAKLIKLLTNFYTQSQSLERPNWMKFLVTSRPYLEIQEGFYSATKLFPRIHIRGEEENEQIHDEINLIVKLRVRELGRIEGLERSTLQRIEKQLLQMEHRTCLWLQLAMDDIRIMLRDSLRPEDEMIRLIPSSVDAAYDKILNRAPPAKQVEVKMILQIIVGARRPLKIEEMAVALGVGLKAASSADLRSAATSGLKAEGFAEKIRHLCGLFVFIDKSKRIFLIHQTAREFLVNVSITEERILAAPELQFKEVVPDRVRKWYHTTLTEANLLLFKVCLAYLTAEQLNKGRQAVYLKSDVGSVSWYDVRRHFPQYLFLIYSLEEWENHAVASSSSQLDELRDLAIKLNIAPALRDLWLLLAAENGQSEVVKMLLKNGANVNVRSNSQYQSPLSLAVQNSHTEIAKLLVDHGADIEILDFEGRTPLWIAVQLRRTDMVKLLVTMGADINAIDGFEGRTTVHRAVVSNAKSMVKLLIELGADINLPSRKKNMTPLLDIVSLDGKSLVALYTSIITPDGIENREAVREGRFFDAESMAKLIIELDADVNATGGEKGRTALQEAVFLNREHMVKLLIELGADIEAKDRNYGASALWLAADGGLASMVKLLINLGANIDAKDGTWELTPLSRAVENADGVFVKLLLELGADIEAKNGEAGLTPLSRAVHTVDGTIFKLLVELGADIEAKDAKWGLTPLSRAAFNNRKGMVKLLIESHADIESRDDRYGMPPLWWAALAGQRDIVKFLVKMGADTKSKNKRGSTILSWATGLEGRESMVKLLVELGCTE